MAKKKRKTTGKNAVTLSLTSQAIDRLAEMAQKSGFSRSAFVENLMAGAVAITAPEAQTSLIVLAETEEENKNQIQINTGVNLSRTLTTAVSDDTTALEPLKEKIAAQEKIIADLEAKLAVAPELKRPVARPNVSEKTAISTVDQTQKVAALEQALKSQENKVQQLTNDLKNLQQELTTAGQKEAALQQQLEQTNLTLAQSQAQNKALTQELESQKATVIQLSQQSAATETAQATLKALGQEKKQLQQQLATATAHKAALQSQITHLEQALQASKDQAATQASLEKAYGELKQQYEAQGDRLRRLESRSHQATGVTSVGEFYLNRWRKY
ncbi:MAG: hypothetical protein VKJ86_10405 [Synechococcus sp.]|nr:hypothetical protein [Synechococcus sp.]